MKAMMRGTILFLLAAVMTSCGVKTQDDYLRKVLSNLEKIESASYSEHIECWQHGDTVPVNTFCRLVNEYNNPADTTIGACFVDFNCDGDQQMGHGYDGKVKVIVYNTSRKVVVDDFTTRSFPYRPVTPPFFNHAKNIIRYAFTTNDSIQVILKELDDHYYLKLIISEDEQVEFFGGAYHIDNPFSWDTTSIYEMWISKSDDLPYKIRREMSHDISVVSSSDATFNKLSLADFDMYSYFPADFEIRSYGDKPDKPQAASLIGAKAPFWELNDMNEQPVSLHDFKSKVLLVNFTGIGCGPCHSAIPFMKRLKNDYAPADFDIVSLETWSRKAHSIKNYSNKNEMNYKLLNATDEVIKDYRTGGAAPVFYILDKDRVVRSVFNGYASGRSDEEIEQAIKELL